MIELDQNERTPICEPAFERMQTSLHSLKDPLFRGRELRASHQKFLFDLAGADEKLFQCVFTGSGAEAVNQVLWSVFLKKAQEEGKCHLITSCQEDAPTLQMMKRLEELGCFVSIVPLTSSGEIDLKVLQEQIHPKTALVSLTLVNGGTGVIQPIEEIAQQVKKADVLLHLDATYAAGKCHLNVADWGVDYLTFSGDRLHAAPHSGALIASRKAPLEPLIVGGGGLRGGAEDLGAFLSLGAAAQQALLYLDRMTLEGARLRETFESRLQRELPGVRPVFPDALQIPNVSLLYFPRVHQEALADLLYREGVRVSLGGSYAPHLRRILEIAHQPNAEQALSFSWSRMTTKEDIEQALEKIIHAVRKLQSVSEGVFHE